MFPVDSRIWAHRVPGHIPDSDDEEQDSEEEDFLETSEERLDAIIQTLGPKWTELPIVEFAAVPPNQRSPSTLRLNPQPGPNRYGGRPVPPSFRIERSNPAP